jgi:hypothetical protein
MDSRWKLLLDIAMGTVIPILVLSNFNAHVGTTGTYLIAALVPVAWVCADLFLALPHFVWRTSERVCPCSSPGCTNQLLPL